MFVTNRAWVIVGILGLGLTASACGGGGGGGGHASTLEARGRVALGAVGGATVDVFRVGDYAAPLVTATASGGGATPADTGRFAFALPNVPPDAVFLLVAHGGQAFDADENGVLDATPTPNRGVVHAIASAAELQAGEVLLSSVTEVVYQCTRYFLEARYDEGYVLSAASSFASFVLATNLAGGPEIDNDDALAFNPLLHVSNLLRQAGPFRSLTSQLLAGSPVAAAALPLGSEELETITGTAFFGDVQLSGGVLYVCESSLGLGMFDASPHSNLGSLGSFPTTGSAVRLQVIGTLAYVTTDDRLQIVDVSDPAQPSLVGELTFPDLPEDVEVLGDVAYVSAQAGNGFLLHLVDVSNPAAPAVLSDFPTADIFPRALRAFGTHVYVAELHRVEVVDVANPRAPIAVGTISTGISPVIDLSGGKLSSRTRADFGSSTSPRPPLRS